MDPKRTRYVSEVRNLSRRSRKACQRRFVASQIVYLYYSQRWPKHIHEYLYILYFAYWAASTN